MGLAARRRTENVVPGAIIVGLGSNVGFGKVIMFVVPLLAVLVSLIVAMMWALLGALRLRKRRLRRRLLRVLIRRLRLRLRILIIIIILRLFTGMFGWEAGADWGAFSDFFIGRIGSISGLLSRLILSGRLLRLSRLLTLSGRFMRRIAVRRLPHCRLGLQDIRSLHRIRPLF